VEQGIVATASVCSASAEKKREAVVKFAINLCPSISLSFLAVPDPEEIAQ
jgi:hypothetical protein